MCPRDNPERRQERMKQPEDAQHDQDAGCLRDLAEESNRRHVVSGQARGATVEETVALALRE
jgi:hypothetical protein